MPGQSDCIVEQENGNTCAKEKSKRNKEAQEDIGLSPSLKDDLDTVINKPRWSALGRFTKERERKKLCEKLLREGNDWLI